MVKNPPADAGNSGLIPGLGRSPLQYSCLENPKDRGAWQATVHRVHKESDMAEQLSTAHRLSLSPVLTLTLTLGLFGKLQGWTFYF